MNNQWLMRTRTLLGDPAMEQLQNATVAVLGLGGVGGAAAEAVCRMGVGRMILIDNDSIDSTNCNRQLFATAQTVGQSKCLAAKERLLSINPIWSLFCHQQFFSQNSDFLFEQQPDLILDAIDTVTSKLYLAQCSAASAASLWSAALAPETAWILPCCAGVTSPRPPAAAVRLPV